MSPFDADAETVPPARTGRLEATFVNETRGDPLSAFPSLLLQGERYNLRLSGRVLEPLLESWRTLEPGGPAAAVAVPDAIERVSAAARATFREVLPAASELGDPAVLAAMGVTANLMRTAALIGEFMFDGGPPRPPPGFRLSRLWCGLVDYAESSPYFPARALPPGDPGRLRANRRDRAHLRAAFRCSARAIDASCAEALEALGREVRESGLFTPDDLGHLHSHAVLPRRS